jgi:hypothetical protein
VVLVSADTRLAEMKGQGFAVWEDHPSGGLPVPRAPSGAFMCAKPAGVGRFFPVGETAVV